MKKHLFLIYLLSDLINPIAAQQNWAAIPCSKIRNVDAIDRMFVDSLHNELILNSINGYKICNTTYKGLVAYTGSGFHDLDKGLNTYDPNASANSLLAWNCITYGDRSLFGGGFYSVGSDTLYTKGIALWNGAVWDTFPTHCFNNTPNNSSGGGFFGFLKYQGKLWMYGKIDTIGNTITKNIVAYDGNTFTAVPAIPVNNNAPIYKMIAYKNKLIAAGSFYNYPSGSFSKLAMYDGTTWAQVGTGVQGGFSFVWDMAIYKDTLYIAGSWPQAAGNAGNYIMKWDGTQLSDAGFGGFCDYGAIRSLVLFKNRLYAFGNFSCAANQTAFGIAYYENGAWSVPHDSIQNLSISSAVVYNDAIYIGGGFLSINGDTTIQKIARLDCPDFDAATGCLSGIKESFNKLNVKVFPNPSSGKLQIEFEQSIAIDKLTILNTLGQEVYKLAKPQPKQEIDISSLSTGIYFLKAENKQGQGIFKIVKEQ